MKQYRGHHNEYAILPLHVNEEEGLLTAGGLTFCYPLLRECMSVIFLMPEECFLATAIGSCKTVKPLKFSRNLALDVL